MSCNNGALLPEPIVEEDLIGRWDVTVRGGLMFVEFTPDNRVLIQDRGAIGKKDSTIYYYQDYDFMGDNTIENLPGSSTMSDIVVEGDKITFTFSSPSTGHRLRYYGKRVEEIEDDEFAMRLCQTWITVRENGIPLAPEKQKIAYFSNTGLFLLKELLSDELFVFGWERNSETQLCYTEYQRPRLVPKPICMNFIPGNNEYLEFEVDGDVIRIEPTLLF